VLEKSANNRRCQILHSHLIDGAAGLGAGERQQQRQRVAVAGLGVAGEVALSHQVLEQKSPDPRAQKVFIDHDGCPHCE
jgi:hypothetical protein